MSHSFGTSYRSSCCNYSEDHCRLQVHIVKKKNCPLAKKRRWTETEGEDRQTRRDRQRRKKKEEKTRVCVCVSEGVVGGCGCGAPQSSRTLTVSTPATDGAPHLPTMFLGRCRAVFCGSVLSSSLAKAPRFDGVRRRFSSTTKWVALGH